METRQMDPADEAAVDGLVDEIEAVRAVQAGDLSAFASLYAAYWSTVHGIVLARARTVEVADVAQDVFVLALQRIGELREPAAFGGWLTTMARRASVDALRRHRPTAAVTDDARVGLPPPRVEARRCFAAIRELPEAYRDAGAAVGRRARPRDRAAHRMTAGSVRVNHRGMRLLRARLGEEVRDG
ncbi:MAG: sigma factor [Nannocystaceae bacterium]